MYRLIIILLLLFTPTLSYSQNWESLEGPVGQIITGITVGPDGRILSASLFGGGFLSTNDGKTWQQLSTGANGKLTTFAEFVGGDTYLLGQSLAIVRSDNGGQTWSASEGLAPHWDESYPNMMRYRDSLYLTFYAGQSGLGLFVSGDGGKTWLEKMRYLNNLHTLGGDSVGGLLLGGAYVVSSSTDRFSTFKNELQMQGNWPQISSVALDSTGSVRLAGSLESGVYYSIRNAEWSAPAEDLPDTIWATAVTPRGIAYMGSTVGVHTSTDGGATWTEYNQGLPPGFVASYLYVAPDGHLYVGTNGAGIFRTEKPVTGAYAVLPPQLSVDRERERQSVAIDQRYVKIAVGEDAEVAFVDVLGRSVAIPSIMTDAVLTIDRASLSGYLTFVIVTEAGSRRVIKLIAD